MRAMAEVRLRVHFEGHVQGVGLRGTLSKYCLRRHVTGWMCNSPDRSLVITELQGERNSIERVIRSIMEFFSDAGRCRGMDYEVVEELPILESDNEMREVCWEELPCRTRQMDRQ